MNRLAERLFRPTDVASLVAFRVVFGLVLVWEVYRYFTRGWIGAKYLSPRTFFSYYGFDWVSPWPGQWIYVHFAMLGIFALFVAIGLFYRISAAIVFILFTWMFLLDQAQYLNHFYLVCLLAFLMIFVPAHRAASLDARFFPEVRGAEMPAWPLWLLRAQLGVVYVFAAIAKMNGDWLRGEPMRMWLANRSDKTLLWGRVPIGRLFESETVVLSMTYGGLLLDLLVVPALLWRPTRWFAVAGLVFFHLTNYFLFDIGIFPWLMLGATPLFFSASWPRRVLRFRRHRADVEAMRVPTAGWRRAIVTLLTIWMAVQVLVPFRHFLYPGMVHWTEEGHRFSWHMKLRNKTARISMRMENPETGDVIRVPVDQLLTPRQMHKMATRPDMLLQFAHHVADLYQDAGNPRPRVFARSECSLNGRPHALLVDPERDLAAIPRDLAAADWILPLTVPLPTATGGGGADGNDGARVDDD